MGRGVKCKYQGCPGGSVDHTAREHGWEQTPSAKEADGARNVSQRRKLKRGAEWRVSGPARGPEEQMWRGRREAGPRERGKGVQSFIRAAPDHELLDISECVCCQSIPVPQEAQVFVFLLCFVEGPHLTVLRGYS